MRAAFPFTGSESNAYAHSLAPGFSPVFKPRCNQNRFNGFTSGGPKPLNRFCSTRPKSTGLKPGANSSHLIKRGPLAARSVGLVLGLLLMAFSASAQQPTTNDVHFLAVDIYVDSKSKPLAAYQLELTVTNGNAKIVGIEGGEHAAFREAPYFDPKAMQQERVIIAAFSTEPVPKLPTGRKRVATIHIQVSGTAKPEFAVKFQVAADAQDKNIPAEAAVEERHAK